RSTRWYPCLDVSLSPLFPPGGTDPLAARPMPSCPRPGAWEVRRWNRPRRCAAGTGEGEDPMGGAIVGADGIARCPWAAGSPALAEYHDTERGLPGRIRRGVFELLCLVAFQVGLSCLPVLGSRAPLRVDFTDHDPTAVTNLTDPRLEQTLTDARLIRHCAQVFVCRTNAPAV